MTESVLTRMVTLLKAAGYQVNTQPQESLKPSEMVIIMDDPVLPVETARTYIMEVKYNIQWLESNIETIPDHLVKVVTTLETGIDEPTFRVEKNPECKILGTWYRMMIKVSYKHRVVIV